MVRSGHRPAGAGREEWAGRLETKGQVRAVTLQE